MIQKGAMWLPAASNILSRNSSSQPQTSHKMFSFLIANFTSANACPCDEFENYCFIKRILSLKEAYVWGRICIDWYISHTPISALFVAARSPHLSSTPPQIWTSRLLTRMEVSVCSNWELYIICTLFTYETRRARQPTSCFEWGSSFVLEVSQLMRNCSGGTKTQQHRTSQKEKSPFPWWSHFHGHYHIQWKLILGWYIEVTCGEYKVGFIIFCM